MVDGRLVLIIHAALDLGDDLEGMITYRRPSGRSGDLERCCGIGATMRVCQTLYVNGVA